MARRGARGPFWPLFAARYNLLPWEIRNETFGLASLVWGAAGGILRTGEHSDATSDGGSGHFDRTADCCTRIHGGSDLPPAALAGPQSASSMTWLDGVDMVYVPAGDFIMGTGVGSTPEKTVYLDGYWIYSTEVTNKMYAQCITTGNCAPPAQEVGAPVHTNAQYGDYPVVGVTWDMAANYCDWAEAKLPTEAQWEKAARGEAGNVFPWGINPPSCSLLNYKGCLGHTSGVIDYPDGRSLYGAFDMAGNVFQWVNDFYEEHAYDSMPSRNPAGPASGNQHVVRGSSFETEASLLPSGVRHPAAADYHNADLGFRCAVQEPKALAPFCQLSSYIPTGAGPSGSTCEVPQTGVQRNYCSAAGRLRHDHNSFWRVLQNNCKGIQLQRCRRQR